MFFVSLAVVAAAQAVAPIEASPRVVATAPPLCCVVPAGTPVSIAITETLRSKKAKTGDRFGIVLASPLIIGGVTVLPVGVTGVGEVIQAAPATFLGYKQGELILAARYLDLDGMHIPLRGFRISTSGAVTTGMVFAGPAVVMYQHGSNIDVSAGTTATAKVAIDLVVPPSSAAAPAGKPNQGAQ